jgi:hypothetical protein
MSNDIEAFYARLEAEGEETVRTNLAKGIYGSRKKPLVLAWLFRKEAEHEAASSARRESREEESLSIARESLATAKAASFAAIAATEEAANANRIARSNRCISISAIVVASISAIIAAFISR